MFEGWGISDYLVATQIVVAVLGILITAFVAIWVVHSVQSKIDNEKVLKDYFSKELIELRSDLRSFMDKLTTGGIKAQSIKGEHHILSIRIQDLLSALNKKYSIDKRMLSAYRLNLMKIVESDKEYEKQYDSNGEVTFQEQTVSKLLALRKNNYHVFNDILISLYETK